MQNYLVVGLGATGRSCVRFLLKKGGNVSVADSREQPPALADFQQRFPNVPMHLGPFSPTAFEQADVIVVSPGVSLNEPVIKQAVVAGKPVIGDVELFAQEASAPIIAVTGSNGKSTLVTLIGQMIKDAGKQALVCGNIGIPVLDVLQDVAVPDYYVLELSSFQLEVTFSLKAKVSVLLNLSPDHLDRHGTMAAYKNAKQRVYLGCEIAVVNADEPELWEALALAQRVSFSLHEGQLPAADWCLSNDGFLTDHGEKIAKVSQLFSASLPNCQNMLAALAVGHAVGLSQENMVNTLKTFQGLAHRCALVSSDDGVFWYNDSKATNVGASIAAIRSIATLHPYKQLFLIAGGDSKGVDLSPLRAPVQEFVTSVILLGVDADKIATILQGAVEIIQVDNMHEAVALAKQRVHQGDVVLLSPACSSLDQYQHFMARGEDFMRAVEAI